MDYQSFQPGGQGQNQEPNTSPPVGSMPGKTITPKFIGLIALLLVLGSSAYAGIWWWGNRQDSQTGTTSDLQIYRNTKYGFEFSYPKSLTLKSSDDNCNDPSVLALECHGFQIFLSRDGLSSTSMEIDRIGSALVTMDAQGSTASEVENFINNLILQIINKRSVIPNDNGVKIYKHPEFDAVRYSFNKSAADYWETKSGHEYDWQVYKYLNDSNGYQIHPVKSDPNFDFYTNVTEQILSTFKFTDSVDTSTWKTYTNTKYGFEITFNDLWKGYTVIENICGLVVKLNQPAIENHPCFIIKLPTQDEQWNKVIHPSSNGYFEAVYLNVYTPSQWVKALKQNKIVIAQNNNYVVAYTTSIDYPPSTNIESLKISETLSTFKFTTPIDTSTWKTYTNTQYGIAFSVPLGWQVQEPTEIFPKIVVTNYQKSYTSDTTGKYSPAIYISKQIDKYSGSITKFEMTMNQAVRLLRQEQTIKIDGITVYVYLGITPPTAHDFRVIFAGGSVYTVTSNNPIIEAEQGNTEAELAKKDFDDFLSTFKFTK